MVIGSKITMTLERYSDARDSVGGVTRSWTGKRFINGALQARRGNEIPRGSKPTVVSTHRFYCDTQIGITITEKDRLKYGTRIFDIVFIDSQVGHLELDLVEKV